MELLIAKGAAVAARDKDRWTPLHWAAASFGDPKWYYEVVKVLVDHGADLNAQSRRGEKPIDLAAQKGDKFLVELLTPKAEDTEADYQSTLVGAARTGNTSVAKTALDRGANPNAKDKEGMTVLRLATLKGHLEVSKLLLDRGADEDIFAAVALTRTNEVIQLLTNNPKLLTAESGDMEIGPPLHFAAQCGNVEMIMLLLAQGADVNSQGPMEMTPLHWAALMGHKPAVEALLTKGAKINARDVQRKTALGWAVFKKHPEVAECLRGHGGTE